MKKIIINYVVLLATLFQFNYFIVDIFNDRESVPMYQDHPSIPDFGKTTGIRVWFDQANVNVGNQKYMYEYNVTLDKQDGYIEKYFEALKKAGFKLISSEITHNEEWFDYEETPVYGKKNETVEIMIAYREGAAFVVHVYIPIKTVAGN